MGVINNAFNQAGLSILSVASIIEKYRARRNEEAKNRARLNYSTAATVKKQINELTKNQSEPPKSYFDIDSIITPEKDEQKIAEQKVSEQMAQERAKATSFGEPPTVSAEHSETNIDAKDPEVQGLIKVKQKNALRAAGGKNSATKYQKVSEQAKSLVGGKIDDVWNEIGLDPNITDKDIKDAGYTKTEILKNFRSYANEIDSWAKEMNATAAKKGIDYATGPLDDYVVAQQNNEFGRAWSALILDKKRKEEIAKREEEETLKSWDDKEEENYKVWQDKSTEEEKDEIKTDRNFTGFKF